MLTATPVHNNLLELYNLVTILRPGHLGTRRAFKDNFVESVRQTAHRNIRHSEKPQPYQLLKPYNHNRGRTWKWGRTKKFSELAAIEMSAEGKKAVREVNYLRAQGYRIYEFEASYMKPTGSAYDETLRNKLLLSHFLCRLRLKSQIRERSDGTRHITPRNPAILRGLLREIMIRNRRRSVGVRFPPRKAAIYALNLTPPERELYDGVTAYIRRQLQAQSQKGVSRMALMTLQKQLCSSPQASARALKNLVRRQDDDELLPYLSLAWDIHQGRKTDAVLHLLEQHPGKFLIFTDYVPTLHALHAALDQAGYKTVLFYGGLSSLDKVEAVRQFRRSARAMISTQSGSEGHNLQFCHQMINYDLPWNPMRIEQRVGRLHRLGQQETVSIFNLTANDTIEAYVLDLLAHKIRMFELVIGELDLILGELGPGRSFENCVEAAWANSYSEAELLHMMAELNAALDQARVASQQIKSVSDELSDLLETYDDEALC
jgi:SNF2 family DNA or RNA helicase